MNSNKNINYNLDFLCTYKSFNENYDSNLCYQIQLLQAFNMNKYDEYQTNDLLLKHFVFYFHSLYYSRYYANK